MLHTFPEFLPYPRVVVLLGVFLIPAALQAQVTLFTAASLQPPLQVAVSHTFLVRDFPRRHRAPVA